jgi:caspase domain-containing protein
MSTHPIVVDQEQKQSVTKIAILVGSAQYDTQAALPCCRNDVEALCELLKATEKYETIKLIHDANADDLKTQLRTVLYGYTSVEEIFYYFSGHGFLSDGEFFCCAQNFDPRRPNETGLSTRDLHTFLRTANPELVVKVIDACSSGMLHIKSDNGWFPGTKGGLNNFVEIASCLDSQDSLPGDPLSEFTAGFLLATLRKTEGTVFYTDVVATLRDEFLGNYNQTPHFVSQGTGREVFLDDANQLEKFRAPFKEKWKLSVQEEVPTVAEHDIISAEPTLLEMLKVAEEKIAKPDQIQLVVNDFFNRLRERLSAQEFADFFDVHVSEHSDFYEPTARGFIIRVLSKENRLDNFVTAIINKTIRRRQDPFGINNLSMLYASMARNDEDIVETHDLHLNYRMDKAQLNITFTPKYNSLRQIVLVVTCAPSLENCYIFEIATQHSLTNWSEYDSEGSEITRRWYKIAWNDSFDGIVGKITTQMREVIRSRLEAAANRLAKEQGE